jgi:excisionase family DNA binding protein
MSTARKIQLPTNLPSEQDVRLASQSSRLLAACIGHGETARLQVIHGDSKIDVPVSALNLLVDILAQMGRGNAVSIVPIHAELTTQQAADFLNVSRPFVVQLLESGTLAHRKVGSHRRVQFKDLLGYREQSTVTRKSALDQLTQEAQELGLGY